MTAHCHIPPKERSDFRRKRGKALPQARHETQDTKGNNTTVALEARQQPVARLQPRKTIVFLPLTLNIIKANQDLQQMVFIQVRYGLILGEKIKKTLVDELIY